MPVKFNTDEVFAMAEKIEENGMKFYRHAAAEFPSFTVREVLLKLAEMESQHHKTFAEMRKRLTPKEKEPAARGHNQGVEAYLVAMADGYVFDVTADPSKLLTGVEAAKDILKMAIGFEKDSIIFYTGLKEIVPEDTGRLKVEEIIRQEMGHITILSGEIAALKG